MFFKANLLAIGLTITGAAALGTSVVSADTTYGGGYGGYGYNNNLSNRSLSIDKKVKNPSSGVYVDQLGVNAPHFAPDQEISFQVTVKNTGNVALSTVTIKDIVPQYLTLTDANLTYDANTKTYSYTMPNLNPGESRVLTMNGKIANASQLPVDNGTFCLVNQAQAISGDQSAQDNAQFCIERGQTTKGGLPVYPAQPVKTTPATGAETLPLMLLPTLSGLGILLRRKS